MVSEDTKNAHWAQRKSKSFSNLGTVDDFMDVALSGFEIL